MAEPLVTPSSDSMPVLDHEGAGEPSPYQRLSQRMQDVTGDRGVLKEVIREGAGDLVTPDASVLVKYSGYLEHMDKPFDTNCYRKVPRLMKLGEEITLWGMEVGLLTMRKGELARFLFKPRYAYGALGCPPLIPPNTTVLFELELLDFLDSAESDEFFALTAKQQDVFPLEKVLKVAGTEREFGNYLFRQNRFHDAKERYKRLERPTRALAYGEQALDIDQKNAKALFRCGRACLIMTEYERARDFLVRAQREQPLNHDINNELKKLASCYRHYMDKREGNVLPNVFSSPFLHCAAELKHVQASLCPACSELAKEPRWNFRDKKSPMSLVEKEGGQAHVSQSPEHLHFDAKLLPELNRPGTFLVAALVSSTLAA